MTEDSQLPPLDQTPAPYPAPGDQRDIVREMEESYLDYAMSVIVSRALPDVRDGLKPVQRRILYAMQKIGLRSTAKYRKSATVVGEVIGKYHPHGDSAIYDAMVRLGQDFSLRYPLVDGHGNFGSIDGDEPAAMRYTEARMAKITDHLLADIDKETVLFRDNFDSSHQEPSVFPNKLPNLLLNGQTGIAVGMATNIPPHNLTEVLSACLALSQDPDMGLDDIMEHIKGPDFPTGGMVYGAESIRQAYATGRGGIVMRGRAEIVEHKGRHRIIITEIPYMVNKSSMLEKMASLVRDKTIIGISDLRDESNREGIRVVVELRKDAFPRKILNQLYKMTPLQESFGCNFVCLIDGIQPRVLDLKSILEEFLQHRQVVVRRRTEYELRLAQERAHILEGLQKALDHIDAVIAIIRGSETKELAKEALMERFQFTERQADAILAMRLQTLAGLERQKILDELAEKLAFIQHCTELLSDEENIRGVVREELLELRDLLGDDRRTEVIPHAVGSLTAKDTIPNEDMIVTISQAGYIKRFSPTQLRTQSRGGKGTKGSGGKEEDTLSHLISTQNHNAILFFTSRGRVFELPVYEIPEASRTARGQALVNFLQLDPEETVTAILDSSQAQGKYLLFGTRKGIIKKTEASQYQNIRKNGLIALSLKEDDTLSWVKATSGKDDVVLVTHQGMSIRFSEDQVRSMGRSATGVKGIKLKSEDRVVEMDIIPENGEADLLVIMEEGLGKKTSLQEFRDQSRGGVGIKCAQLTKKTGKLAAAKVLSVDESQDLLISTQAGQAIRLPISDVPVRGRATQGVILMRLPSDDKVASLSLVVETPLEQADAAEQSLEEVPA